MTSDLIDFNDERRATERAHPERVLVWFSCGAASAVAAKKSLELYGHTHEVLIVNCDTRNSEHPDNYRYSADCEKWFGQTVLFIRNNQYEDVDDVFDQTRYMSGVRGARCTAMLKKVPRLHFSRPTDWHVFGYTADGRERKRLKDFRERNPALRVLDPLGDLGLTKFKCHLMLSQAGIRQAAMYALGFNNNNCPGCVKASSPWYWAMVRKHFPEVFKRRCEQSRELGVRLVEIHHHERIFLDELPPGEPERFKNRRSKKEDLSCGPECGPKRLE